MPSWGKKVTGPARSTAAVVRSVSELRDVADPAWPALVEAVASAEVTAFVLPTDERQAEDTLYRLQVSAASTLGALALHCGALIVDHGWLRVLGAGRIDLPGLAGANVLPSVPRGSPPPHLVVAYDAIGGVFAVDGGGLRVAPGDVCYRGPDTLTWETVGAGHSAFVHGALSGALGDFFDTLRWPGWERDIGPLGPQQGLSLHPPPFTEQGRDLALVSRRAVPLTELLAFYDDMAGQLADAPDGQPFTMRVTE